MNDISKFFKKKIVFDQNMAILNNKEIESVNNNQTNSTFSEKWNFSDTIENKNVLFDFQKEWFLKLYGFKSKKSLINFLKNKNIILDAGCGLGYKSEWLAKLAPHAIVIGIDISESILIASKKFKKVKNLFFIKADIAKTGLKNNIIDFTVCDQVIMHTENPVKTFNHLSKITSKKGEFACYVYRKKALPRELLDDYFRKATHKISNDDLWKMSSQLSELGKRLSELNVSFDAPEIPLLGIKKGRYDIQRFIYWNFLKCFWKDDWGKELSDITNFDWYAPSNAKRFNKEEFLKVIKSNQLKINFFNEEEACYSARMSKI